MTYTDDLIRAALQAIRNTDGPDTPVVCPHHFTTGHINQCQRITVADALQHAHCRH